MRTPGTSILPEIFFLNLIAQLPGRTKGQPKSLNTSICFKEPSMEVSFTTTKISLSVLSSAAFIESILEAACIVKSITKGWSQVLIERTKVVCFESVHDPERVIFYTIVRIAECSFFVWFDFTEQRSEPVYLWRARCGGSKLLHSRCSALCWAGQNCGESPSDCCLRERFVIFLTVESNMRVHVEKSGTSDQTSSSLGQIYLNIQPPMFVKIEHLQTRSLLNKIKRPFGPLI